MLSLDFKARIESEQVKMGPSKSQSEIRLWTIFNDPLEKGRFKEKIVEYITIGSKRIYSVFWGNRFLSLGVTQINHAGAPCKCMDGWWEKEKLKAGRIITKQQQALPWWGDKYQAKVTRYISQDLPKGFFSWLFWKVTVLEENRRLF